MQYCLYLRKSRTDAEAEARGEGETLARHEKILLQLAKKSQLNVTHIYREVVSGETIAARPVMQQLLGEVEQGLWTGVFVMEIERLARGDTIDQGIMAQTFKYSDTKIITPMKTYNPNDEYDEEYFEFGLFMSRREYKTINRRLQRGRIAAVKEGKFVGNKAPYGYDRVKLEKDKGWTLKPNEDEADVVKLIFELYTNGEKQEDGSYKRLGTALIVRRLNSMGILAKMGGEWIPATIRDILTNPTYIGKLRWNRRATSKKMVDGQVVITRPRSDDYLLVDGLHPPLISKNTFKLAAEYLALNPPRPIGESKTVKNPLSGLVVCQKCGRRMVRRPYSNKNTFDTLMCPVTSCDNVSSALHLVEEQILKGLHDWLEEYKLQWGIMSAKETISQAEVKKKALSRAESELVTLQKQIDKTHDLLEQGVYDTDMFLERSHSLIERISKVKADIITLQSEVLREIAQENSQTNVIPEVEKLLDVYYQLETAKDKNDILKNVIEKVEYLKQSSTRWHGSPEDFEITLYPKIPEHSEK